MDENLKSPEKLKICVFKNSCYSFCYECKTGKILSPYDHEQLISRPSDLDQRAVEDIGTAYCIQVRSAFSKASCV